MDRVAIVGVRGRWREIALSVSVLFASTGTLICCALPILLVSVGLGASVAALTGSAPWLVELSRYKAWMFLGSALLLGAAGWFIRRPGRACPKDPLQARACELADRCNRRIWWLAAAIWGVGAFAAYLWLPLRRVLGI